MMIFGRAYWSQVVLTLSSNEVLGDIVGGYVEDYYGGASQITLHCIETSQRFAMLMGELTGSEPLPHEVFRGYYDLDLIPDGHYMIEGRIRDTVGNYTILSAFSSPIGTEQTITLEFEVIPGVPASRHHVRVVNVDAGVDLRRGSGRVSVGDSNRRISVVGRAKRALTGSETRRVDAAD